MKQNYFPLSKTGCLAKEALKRKPMILFEQPFILAQMVAFK